MYAYNITSACIYPHWIFLNLYHCLWYPFPQGIAENYTPISSLAIRSCLVLLGSSPTPNDPAMNNGSFNHALMQMETWSTDHIYYSPFPKKKGEPDELSSDPDPSSI